MLQLIKLYSDANKFKEIEFKPGINLILGLESTSDSSILVNSRKMNGVGKSLVIELINFCLLKKRDQSRIFSLPESVMSKIEYVNLHFKINDEHYIFSRNKKGEIKIKSGLDGDFIQYEELDAKSYLRTILSLNDLDLSAREYLNFLIKEEDYNYSKFPELYRSSDYASLLRVHFFFYGLPMQILTSIRSAFEEHNEATKLIKKIKDGLSVEGIDFKELESKKNQYDDDIKQMESDIKYEKIMNTLGDKKKDFIKVENEISSLLTEKSILQIELDEINSFSNIFSDDIYIDDNDLQIVFNKYSQGLGDIVKKDIEALKVFRDQLIDFNNDFLNTKKKELESSILKLSRKINFLYSQIDESSKVAISDTTSSVISSFRIYREKISQFERYNKLMDEKELADS